MSDIFSVEVPRWLQAIAKPASPQLFGEAVGGGLAALYNAAELSKESKEAAEKDSNVQAKSWLQEIPSGLAMARMNQADPLWKIKQAQAGALISQRNAQAQLAYQRAEEMAHESELAAQELPLVNEWSKDPSQPEPMVQSKLANQEKDRIRKDKLIRDTKNLELKKAEEQIAGLNQRQEKRAHTAIEIAGMRGEAARDVAEIGASSREVVADVNATTRLAIAAERGGMATPKQKEIVRISDSINTLTQRVAGAKFASEQDPSNQTLKNVYNNLSKQLETAQLRLARLADQADASTGESTPPPATTAPAPATGTPNPSRFKITPARP